MATFFHSHPAPPPLNHSHTCPQLHRSVNRQLSAGRAIIFLISYSYVFLIKHPPDELPTPSAQFSWILCASAFICIQTDLTDPTEINTF